MRPIKDTLRFKIGPVVRMSFHFFDNIGPKTLKDEPRTWLSNETLTVYKIIGSIEKNRSLAYWQDNNKVFFLQTCKNMFQKKLFFNKLIIMK